MRRILFVALLAAATVLGQQNDQRTTKLVHLKYVDPEALRAIVSQFGVNVVPNSSMKVMTLSGLPPQIAAAEAAIQQLDVAPKDIELVVHFVVGSDQANLVGSPIPSDIRDVISQLKSTFTYKDYRMLDVLTLRSRAGSSAETTGILDSKQSPPRLTMFSVRNTSVSEDGATIRIDRMHAGLRIPTGGQKPEYVNTGIDQDIDVKAGQKVVVGRASLEGPEKALFLILTARVM
ncbi:MAG TPA: secretin N-terminal domain-containing protein [Verrucomicrobiae bacterium]|nr:secretin N-terminal domain-containing protein [Verrucomicrobiae bacterium]